tara:strand:- start:6486 stop:7496 length:1011 start_codon:yes stop_codon:yes gene_type:complete
MTKIKANREKYIDAVKGFTIILVVLHHVVSGTNAAMGLPGWFMVLYKLTVPIRMPLFFLVAGFFAKKALSTSFTAFADSKLIHFAYFYILWNTIDVIIRSSLSKYANNSVEFIEIIYFPFAPSFSLWFLYVLFFAFLIAYILKDIKPTFQLAIVFSIAIIVQYTIYYELSFVVRSGIKFLPFFFVGIYLSQFIRTLVGSSAKLPISILTLLMFIGIAWLVNKGFGGFNDPLFFYPAAFCSSMFFLTAFRMAQESKVLNVFNFIGKRSLYIYVMHFLPAALFRIILSKYMGVENKFVIVTVATISAVVCCIIVYETFKNVSYIKYLFERPLWTRVRA